MTKCDYCGKKIDSFPHKCKFCGKIHCSEHLLPESHDCDGLKDYSLKKTEKWKNDFSEIINPKSKNFQSNYDDFSSGNAIKHKDVVNNKKIEKKKKIFKWIKNEWIPIFMMLFLILILVFPLIYLDFLKTCENGTAYGYCSSEKPFYCSKGDLVKNSTYCGCPEGYESLGNDCVKIPTCSDGTFYFKCSSKKPLYCNNGELVDKASKCGCPSQYIKDGEKCISKYRMNPQDEEFKYFLDGKSKSFDWKVYGGMNNYLSSIPRSITYDLGDSEPTIKDFLSKNIDNEKQKEFLMPFVDKIRDFTDDPDDRVRIAVSIVQNIPYDYSNNLDGRYAYEVLYDDKGVCGEKSKLLVFILRELGYGSALFTYGPKDSTSFIKKNDINHQAVGVKCPLKYSYDNTGYCFIETTTPSIITDDQGDYPKMGCQGENCLTKLQDNYTLTIVSGGKSFDTVKKEYEDARDFIRLNNIEGYLTRSQYKRWENLIERYGIKTTTSVY